MSQRTAFDWSQFHLGIFVQGVQPNDLYALWATSEGLIRWFVREADFAPSDTGPPQNARERRKIVPFDDLTPRGPHELCQTNDRYRWDWYYDGGIRGEHWILDARAPSKLVFGFGEGMEVDVTIRKQAAGCEVSLRQYHIPTTLQARHHLHLGCRVAWAFFLTNLKSLAEGGLDLRETDLSRSRRLHFVNI